MEEDEIPGDSGEEGDEIVILKSQDDKSEVRFQEKQAFSRENA